jgi:hypothetical protein
MPSLWWDAAVLGYFASHIAATLCIDGQALAPALGLTYPAPLVALLQWWVDEAGDVLMAPREQGGRPPWFVAIIAAEVALQLPFFFVALYGWWHRRQWLRTPLLIYGEVEGRWGGGGGGLGGVAATGCRCPALGSHICNHLLAAACSIVSFRAPCRASRQCHPHHAPGSASRACHTHRASGLCLAHPRSVPLLRVHATHTPHHAHPPPASSRPPPPPSAAAFCRCPTPIPHTHTLA